MPESNDISPVIAFMVAQATGEPVVQPQIAPSVVHRSPFSFHDEGDD